MADNIIGNLDGVRGGEPDFPVQLVFDEDSHRVMVRAINEGGYACTEIDLLDLVLWLQKIAPDGVNIDAVSRAITLLSS
jgi:hypothetical protein